MMQIETAHVTHLRDQRTDARRILEEAKERIEQEAGNNGVMGDVSRESLLALTEAIERLSVWCPELFGPGVPVVDERCTCWRCSYDEPFCDPFEGQDEPG